ncbi:hypothetical protein POP72_011 [Pectobacterium phage POP72]|uniref:Uncharacterized protein n=1 Tax=Pectobacterium phage POP72 TaxID=1965269 RepID=A0A2R2V0S4_9CAUD|nr:hypothetical protein POP72_011 [Pectobacterium phage POP72]
MRNIEKMTRTNKQAFGEVEARKGSKRNKTVRGASNKRNWQEEV